MGLARLSRCGAETDGLRSLSAAIPNRLSGCTSSPGRRYHPRRSLPLWAVASEHPTEGYLVRRSLVGSTIVPCQWAHHRPRSHVSCHAGPAGPKARRGGYLVGGRRSTYDLRVRVRKQGVVSFVAEQWKMHACKSQQRMVYAWCTLIWACVLAGFYSVGHNRPFARCTVYYVLRSVLSRLR